MYSLTLLNGPEKHETTSESLLEALNEFKSREIQIGGMMTLKVSNGINSREFAYKPWQLRRLLVNSFLQEVFQKRAKLLLGEDAQA